MSQVKGDDDDREEENATFLWMLSIGVASIAMAIAGKLWLAGMFAVLCGLFWLIGSRLLKPLSIGEKKAIEYNIWSAEDCYAEAKEKNLDYVSKLALLAALLTKYNRMVRASTPSLLGAHKAQQAHVDAKLLITRREEVAIICHDTAHEIIFQEHNHPLLIPQQQDQVLDAAIALLALVATESVVRRRYDATDNTNRLVIILQVLHQARQRAKHYRDPDLEQRAAELQRKGCLLLGALVNRNKDSECNEREILLGKQILANGGMQCILDALSWFRFHEHVANWALWAMFTLLYDQEEGEKTLSSSTTNMAIQHLLNANGGPIILAALENCGHHVDVARHGIAILFHIVVAKKIPFPPAPVIRIVEQLLSVHTSTGHEDPPCDYPTKMDKITNSSRQQIALMGRDILVQMGAATTKATINI